MVAATDPPDWWRTAPPAPDLGPPAMPIKSIFQTEIKHTSILDEKGKFDAKLGKDLIPNDDLVRLYEHMLTCRVLDEVAFKLQRSGRMGTYPQNMGQEATSLGAPAQSSTGGGASTSLSIPIGTQMLHATGIAWASKYKGTGEIACTFFWDGATSEGDFHEAANFAANLDIPVIFFCQNNGWAISVPSKIQSSAPTFAQRGIAYGMECHQVDGNDLFAVVKVMKDAVRTARETNRPVFIEALTYRLGDHTTADDARRYRDAAELEAWKARDPLLRLEAYMTKTLGIWSPEKQEAARAAALERVEATVKEAEGIAPPHKDEFFDHMYAEIPADLARQRDTMRTSGIGQDPSQIATPAHAGG